MPKFGEASAAKLRRRGPKPGDIRHVDEVSIRINGVLHYLWRAVDQHGAVLDLLGRLLAGAEKGGPSAVPRPRSSGVRGVPA